MSGVEIFPLPVPFDLDPPKGSFDNNDPASSSEGSKTSSPVSFKVTQVLPPQRDPHPTSFKNPISVDSEDWPLICSQGIVEE